MNGRKTKAKKTTDSLSRYREKRDFATTSEPKGKRPQSKSQVKSARFVVQRHDARRLHYDLRLEADGVYKSWAVTKVPSLDPATKRLAVQVEDHPLEYGTFEGTIPKGEYGGGTVQLWDRGRWQSQTGNPFDADEKKGQIKITFKGKRLKGGWALIRLKRGGGKNWILIKEKDDEAKPGKPDALLHETKSVKTGRTLSQIARDEKSRT